jgi:hypothetical protein
VVQPWFTTIGRVNRSWSILRRFRLLTKTVVEGQAWNDRVQMLRKLHQAGHLFDYHHQAIKNDEAFEITRKAFIQELLDSK